MLKVAVISNSHVAALNDAIKKSPEIYKDIDFTFFAAPARLAHKIKFEDGIIKPTSDDTVL